MTSASESPRKMTEIDHLYDYVPLHRREPLRWPDGNRIAAVIVVSLEAFHVSSLVGQGPATVGLPLTTSGATSISAPGHPERRNRVDVRNYTWREYGVRVGIWRLFDLLDRLGVPVSCQMSADLPARYPQVAEAVRQRGWEIVAHSTEPAMQPREWFEDPERERQLIRDTTETLAEYFGNRPKGWCSPDSAGTLHTPRLLAEEGFIWCGDFANDEQPYLMQTGSRRLVAIPADPLLDDYHVALEAPYVPSGYVQTVNRYFDALYEDGARSGRVFCLGLHPHVMGRPNRIRALSRTLDQLRRHERVWWTTRDQIAEWYLGQER